MDKSLDLASISDIAGIVTAIASLAIGWMVYNYTQKSDKNSQSRQLNLEMQTFNQMILFDDKLLKIEAENHPPELGKIDFEDARKMYLYFSWINMADNIVRARDNDLMDHSLADARLSNLSRVLAADSKFIRQHVLPRGYIAQPVIKELTRHWPPA